ncbi:MAG: phosphoenolpyruvate--protein phosphotransferase [Burkholderiaceae bacterium]|nr:phosphoenolpyruvate--protein phosphotransferase [Burkholderiaceae bacterium]
MAYSFTLHGIPVSRGIAIGRAHLIAPAALEVQHYLVPQEQVETEVGRLENAITTVHKELENLWTNLPKDSPVELGAFLDVHAMILSDPLISEAPLEIIRKRRYNAEWALVTQIEHLTEHFEGIEDLYLRERKADIKQIGERVLKVLTGSANPLLRPIGSDHDKAHMIVVAHDISPADMIQFREQTFSGFMTDLGGQNSHAAIVARSLDIPAVVGTAHASDLIEQDDWVVIDGDVGVVIVDPSPLVLDYYRARQATLLKARKKLSKLKKTLPVTLDGTPVTLLANIEFPEDCAAALDVGAQGVGLFRSEFLFMSRPPGATKMPGEEEQFEAYKKAVLAMRGRPVTIRTLDIGADKQLDPEEQTALNPALGLRAIRYCLAEPKLFLTQLRAILRASAFGKVKLLLPMIAHAFEVDQALAMIEQAKAQLRTSGKKFDADIEVGAMIEVPAAVLALPIFISRLDFLSIGTNDLIQYALAIDRGDHEVAHLYNPLHPAILQLLSMTLRAGEKSGIPVSMCGEVAGDPRLTRLLLGMGLREFSMYPSQLLAVKQEVLNCDLRQIASRTKKILSLMEPAAIEHEVTQLRALQATPAV